MGYHEAFDSLVCSKPKSGLKKAVKRLMLENVKTFFQDENTPDESIKAGKLAKKTKQIDEDWQLGALKSQKTENGQNGEFLGVEDIEQEKPQTEDLQGANQQQYKFPKSSFRNMMMNRPQKKKKKKIAQMSSSRRLAVSRRDNSVDYTGRQGSEAIYTPEQGKSRLINQIPF